ncbi:putative NAD dependent epimerase/dehydratase [Whalleya microplaca]|nr:putative NAD dependent epimerase/dehydratase [Whalleya microplaca]
MSSKTVFITGASGFIGSAVMKLAIALGYKVRGLSRSETSDDKIKSLGGIPVRGDLYTLDVLAREASNADIVIQLGDVFIGSNFSMPYDKATEVQNTSVDAMAGAMEETNKPLVIASSALITRPDPDGGETTEEDPDDTASPIDRGPLSRHALAWSKRGVRVIAIRLAPLVYGHGGSGLTLLLQMAATSGAALTIDGGALKTSVVHVDDVARLFLLAAEKSPAGEAYNGIADNTISFADLATEASVLLDVPVQNTTFDQAAVQLGPAFANILTSPCRGSNVKARKVLGWEVKEAGVYEDLRTGSYAAVASRLKKSKLSRS